MPKILAIIGGGIIGGTTAWIAPSDWPIGLSILAAALMTVGINLIVIGYILPDD